MFHIILQYSVGKYSASVVITGKLTDNDKQTEFPLCVIICTKWCGIKCQ